MARIRSLHPGQASDEDFVALSMEARVFCLLLRCHADDQGVFEWKPKTLKMKIFPADNVDVGPLLGELEENKQVKRFEIDGRSYGAIRNFRKYQRPKKPSNSYPLPDELRPYVGLSSCGSEPVENHDDDDGESPPQREEGGDISEDISSGAGAPLPAVKADPWKAIYDGFKRCLGTKSGGLISKLRQCAGEPEMAQWLEDMSAGRIANPHEYFGAIIEKRKGFAKGSAALIADPPSRVAYRKAFAEWDSSGRTGDKPTLAQFAHLDRPPGFRETEEGVAGTR